MAGLQAAVIRATMGRYAREPENATKSCKVRWGWREDWSHVNRSSGLVEAVSLCIRLCKKQRNRIWQPPGSDAPFVGVRVPEAVQSLLMGSASLHRA